LKKGDEGGFNGFLKDESVTVFADYRSKMRSQGMGSIVKKRRKKIAKHKHRKLLKKTRVQRRKRK
jgi:hypothetical protein